MVESSRSRSSGVPCLGILAIFGLCAAVGLLMPDRKEGATAAAPTNTPRAVVRILPTWTPAVPTRVPSISERLATIANDTKPAGCTACTVEYHPESAGLFAVASVTCPLTTVLTAGSGMSASLRGFVKLAPAVWRAVPDLGVLNAYYDATFIDTYGKESTQHLLTVQLTRDTAAKIVWENMNPCRMSRAADVCKPHSGERAAFDELCE